MMELGFDLGFLLFGFNFLLNTVAACFSASIGLKNTINIALDERHHKYVNSCKGNFIWPPDFNKDNIIWTINIAIYVMCI